MTVTERTPTRLRLDATTWMLSGVLLAFTAAFALAALRAFLQDGDLTGLIGVAIGAALLVLVTKRNQFWADRNSGKLILRERSFFGLQEQVLDLSWLSAAETEHFMGRGQRKSFQTVLRMKDGSLLRFGAGWTDEYHAGNLATLINGWLAGTPSLQPGAL